MSNKIVSSFIWKFLESGGIGAIMFVVSLILARLLAPEDYGLLALAMVIIALAGVLGQGGLKNALVQKKDSSTVDFSTIFWISLMFSAVFYAVLFFAAPMFAKFYENEKLILVMRVLGLSLFFGAFSSVQDAYIQKHFLFKKLFFRSMAVAIPSGILGITLAYLGFGIWALVWQQLTTVFLSCVFMLFMVPWRPTLEFSVKSAKKLFNYGYKLQLSWILDIGYNNLITLLIGKVFSPAVLGFYNKGRNFPDFIVSNVNQSINAVLFPALADVQDDIERFKQRTRTSIKCSCFIIFPLMALLASSAAPTVKFLLGEKWLPCVIFLQISCFIFALWPLSMTNLTAINSLGRSDIFLKLEIIKKVIGVTALTIALYQFRTPAAVVIGCAITGLVDMFIDTFPNKKLLNYGFGEQVMDIAPSFILAFVCGFAVYPITHLEIPSFAMIAMQVPTGLALYMFLAKTFKMESYQYMFSMLKDKFVNRKLVQPA